MGKRGRGLGPAKELLGQLPGLQSLVAGLMSSKPKGAAYTRWHPLTSLPGYTSPKLPGNWASSELTVHRDIVRIWGDSSGSAGS